MNHHELPIHVAILDALNAALPERATRPWHTPNEGDHHVKFRNRLRDMGLRAGVGDLSFVLDGIYHEIEVKSARGRQSPEQERRQAEIWRAGGRYAVCRSVADLRDTLTAWGIAPAGPIPGSTG